MSILIKSMIDESFFKREDKEKAYFTSYIPHRYKRMYDWLRAAYPDSPISNEIKKAIVEKIEEINRKAPKPFEDVG